MRNVNKKHLSIKDLRKICQPKEILDRPDEDWYSRRVGRRISIYFTRLFILLKLSPDQVSIIGLLAIDTLGLIIPVNLQLGPDIGVLISQIVQLGLQIVTHQPLLFVAVMMITMCWAAVWILYLLTLKLEGLSIIQHLPSLFILGLIGFGISISNTLQSAKGLLSNKTWSFERTPKYALKQRVGEWRNKSYQVHLNITFYFELVSIIFSIVTIFEALRNSNIGIVVILVIYVASYGFVTILTFFHRGTSHHNRADVNMLNVKDK